jgi:hypothetical protein
MVERSASARTPPAENERPEKGFGSQPGMKDMIRYTNA